MTTRLGTFALLVIALFVVCDSLFPNMSATRRWEYTILSTPDALIKQALANYGASGWELVFARRAMGANNVPGYEVILKRSARVWSTSGVIEWAWLHMSSDPPRG